jgi:hypothetical protein
VSEPDNPSPNQPQPGPDDGHGGNQKRDISGKIGVSGYFGVDGPITVDFHPDIKRQKEASDGQKETREQKKYALENRTFWVIFVYAGLTFGLTIFGAIQSCASMKSANAAKEAVKVASDTLCETKRISLAQDRRAQEALNATRDAMRIDQRAWVAVVVPPAPLVIGGESAITFIGKNVGKTPALNVSRQYALNIRPKKSKFTLEYGDAIVNVPALFPTEVMTTRRNADIVRNTAEADAVSSGDLVIRAYGRTCYDDVFGVHHWARFCTFYNPESKVFEGCLFYNEIDTDKTRDDEKCGISETQKGK